MEETIIMNEEDIIEILTHNYWPVVDIDESIPQSDMKFVAKLYKNQIRGKRKGWRLIKTRTFKTPLEAWNYLKETLTDTLKFVK